MYLQIPHPRRPIKPEPDGDEVRAPERRAKTSLAKLIANVIHALIESLLDISAVIALFQYCLVDRFEVTVTEKAT